MGQARAGDQAAWDQARQVGYARTVELTTMNNNYESNITLAKAIYDAMCDNAALSGADVPYMIKVSSEGGKAYSITPYEQLPMKLQDKIYDLVIEVVQQAIKLK